MVSIINLFKCPFTLLLLFALSHTKVGYVVVFPELLKCQHCQSSVSILKAESGVIRVPWAADVTSFESPSLLPTYPVSFSLVKLVGYEGSQVAALLFGSSDETPKNPSCDSG